MICGSAAFFFASSSSSFPLKTFDIPIHKIHADYAQIYAVCRVIYASAFIVWECFFFLSLAGAISLAPQRHQRSTLIQTTRTTLCVCAWRRERDRVKKKWKRSFPQRIYWMNKQYAVVMCGHRHRPESSDKRPAYVCDNVEMCFGAVNVRIFFSVCLCSRTKTQNGKLRFTIQSELCLWHRNHPTEWIFHLFFLSPTQTHTYRRFKVYITLSCLPK